MNAPAVAPLNPPELVVSSHGQQYSDWAYNDPAGIITSAYRNLQGIEFDTFVCRGISGILVAPLLARAMSRNFLIVRKPNEYSHSWSEVEGTFGHRWVFLDDFISGGTTFHACRDAVERYVTVPHSLVGVYLYQMMPNGNLVYPAERRAATWGCFRHWDSILGTLKL